MATLDTKKIGSVLKQLEAAAKAGVKLINESTNNSLTGSSYEKHPLQSIGGISLLVEQLSAHAQAESAYVGMTEEEIAEAKAAEREAELAALQQLTQDRLAEYTKVPEVVPADEADEVVDNTVVETEITR